MSRTTTRFVLALASFAATLSASIRPAEAVTATWLANPGLAGTFNAATNWDTSGDLVPGDGVPTVTDDIKFDNNSGAAYLVTFTGDIQTEQFYIGSDKITFDLAGNRWSARVNSGAPFDYGGGAANTASWIGVAAGQNATVTFSSSVAASDPTVDNVVRNFDNSGFVYRATRFGGYGAGSATVNIDNSLGYGVTVYHTGVFSLAGNSTLNINGVGSEFTAAGFAVQGTLGAGGDSFTNLTNGAKFTHPGLLDVSGGPGLATVNIESGSTVTSTSARIGLLNSALVNINSGGKWNGTAIDVGLYHYYDALPISARVNVDGATSQFNGTTITLGTGAAGQDSNAEIRLTNGGSMSVNSGSTTGLAKLLLNVLSPGAISAGRQANTITLDTGFIHVAGTGTDLRQIENHGVIRGAGTIDSGSSGFAFTMTNGSSGSVDVGDTSGPVGVGSTIGTLTLNNGSFIQTAGATTYFDFDPTTSGSADLIDISGGTATLAGTVDFDATGIIGVGTWDFIKASSISYSAADNMSLLLPTLSPNPEWLITFGVVTEGGFDYLRLSVSVIPAPEPSSFLLLSAGCLALMGKKRRVRK